VPGFFVDVGAHHPFRFSNTYLFYRLGWRGVNIDAMPGSMEPFRRHRPGDINIESGVGSKDGQLPFYVFNEPALNSFDEALSRSRESGTARIITTVQVPIVPLHRLIKDHVPRRPGPSFLTVDVEGRDLDVLRSNDWAAFRPTFVLAESCGTRLAELNDHPLTRFMNSLDYVPTAKTVNTVFFRDGRLADA
jgi:FkbM family methyltransferase